MNYDGNDPTSVIPVMAQAVEPLPFKSTAPNENDDERPSPTSPLLSNNFASHTAITELKFQGFTEGLAQAAVKNRDSFPIRFWIVDNSGSMNIPDGHLILPARQGQHLRFADCTRWEEIRECVEYHASYAALMHNPTNFRLLNKPGTMVGPQIWSIGERSMDNIQTELYNAKTLMDKVSPGGYTPLRQHILNIHELITPLSDKLSETGQKAVIVIATDGKPTDEAGNMNDFATSMFVDAMRRLEGLPVWVVIRLCTDDNEVVEYYNNLDENVELSLEVLDDYQGEAQEVFEMNPWINYALPIHRLRENGFSDRIFDLIDERSLTKSEMRQYCLLIFGEQEIPDPNENWSEFIAEVKRLNALESMTYNPIKKRMTHWIDINMLQQKYGDISNCQCTIM